MDTTPISNYTIPPIPNLFNHIERPINFPSSRYEECYDAILNNDLSQNDKLLQLQYLKKLYNFDLGKHLIDEDSLDAYWTDFLTSYPDNSEYQNMVRATNDNDLLLFLTEKAPIILATQQRLKIFSELIQSDIINNVLNSPSYTIANFGCGYMRDILSCNFSCLDASNRIYGIDTNPYLNEEMQNLFNHYHDIDGINPVVELIVEDAWTFQLPNKADLIVSNGINIYEPDDQKVTNLYKNFADNLIDGGRLIISVITPLPGDARGCSWEIDTIDPDDLHKQSLILQAAQVKWTATRTVDQSIEQLKEAGFNSFKVFYDQAQMFPAIYATK